MNPTSSINGQSQNTARILLLDDDRNILHFLLRALFKQGFTVQAVDQPTKALDLLARNRFDLVITDLKMPEMDGIVFLKRIKESSPTTEVILMTAFATVETALEAMKLGAFDFLVKPFNLEELTQAVQRALRYLSTRNDLNQFKDLDRIKNEFLSNVTHELRSPLTSIKASSKLLLEEFKSKGMDVPLHIVLQMLSMIDKNSNKMIGLVDDLLDTFRYQTNKITLNNMPFSVEKLIAKCVEEFLLPCQERGLTLSCHIEGALPNLTADPIEIKQAILNLLGNSMKFTPEGGKIIIGAQFKNQHGNGEEKSAEGIEKKEMIEIFVEDTGIGVPEEEQEKIFEKFYQVDGSIRRKQNGIGLGLSLTKSIVEAHHGKIKLESSPGKGSIFYMQFPLKNGASESYDMRRSKNSKSEKPSSLTAV
ncbi:MAG: response regulator [Elusimicrobia bacterium]|nr:response regulator [Elusimicrobiota bacterium]